MSSQNNSVNGLTTTTSSSEAGWQKAGTRKQRRPQRTEEAPVEVQEEHEEAPVEEQEEQETEAVQPASPTKPTWASRLKTSTAPAPEEETQVDSVSSTGLAWPTAVAHLPPGVRWLASEALGGRRAALEAEAEPKRKTPTAGAPTPARKTYPASAAKTPSGAPKHSTAPGAPVKGLPAGQKAATTYKGTPRINRTLDFSKAPRAERTERAPRPNADAYKAALTAAEDAFFNECLCEAEAKGKMKGVPVEQRRRAALDDLHAQAGCILNWSAVAVNAPIYEDFPPVTIGDTEVVFSRRKFAENRFFQRKLRDYYLGNLPDNCWVAFRLVGKPAAPGQPSTEGLLIRVGNRIA